jgi:hypothetical protein
MIEIIPPLGKYKYDTWRILPVKCYIDNFVRLQSCIWNINNVSIEKECLSVSTIYAIQPRDQEAKKIGSLKYFEVCGIQEKEPRVNK